MKPRSITTPMDEATVSFGSRFALVARAPGLSAARPGRRRRDHPASPQLSGVWACQSEPGDDPAARHRAGHRASPAERPASRGRLRAGVAGERLSAPELAQVNGALDGKLAEQEPYPAFVVDRRWKLLRANAGAGRFVEFLTGPAPATAAASAEPVNLAVALVSPMDSAPSLSTGRRSPWTFSAACRPTPSRMVRARRPSFSRGCSPSPASRRSPRSRRRERPGRES